MEKQTIEYSRRENLLGCVTFDLLKNYRQQSSKLGDIIRLRIGMSSLFVDYIDSEELVGLTDLEAGFVYMLSLGGIYRRGSSSHSRIADALCIRALDIYLAVLDVELVDNGSHGRIEIALKQPVDDRAIIQPIGIYVHRRAEGNVQRRPERTPLRQRGGRD